MIAADRPGKPAGPTAALKEQGREAIIPTRRASPGKRRTILAAGVVDDLPVGLERPFQDIESYPRIASPPY